MNNYLNDWLPIARPPDFIAMNVGHCFYPWLSIYQCRLFYSRRMGIPVSKVHTPVADSKGYVLFTEAAAALRQFWKYLGCTPE